MEGGDDSRKFNAEGLRGLGRERVLAFALQEIHAVEAERVDFDEGLGGGGGWGGGGGVGVEGGDGAGVVVDGDGAHCFGGWSGGHGSGGDLSSGSDSGGW